MRNCLSPTDHPVIGELAAADCFQRSFWVLKDDAPPTRLQNLDRSGSSVPIPVGGAAGIGLLLRSNRRFNEIEGMHLSLVIAMNLFVAVIPLLILGYAILEAFNPHRRFGTVLVHAFHLTGSIDGRGYVQHRKLGAEHRVEHQHHLAVDHWLRYQRNGAACLNPRIRRYSA